MLELLDKIEERFRQVAEELSQPDVFNDQGKLKALSREHRHLEEIHKLADQYRKLVSDTAGAREIVDSGGDAELVEMARTELAENEQKLTELEEKLRVLLVPRDPNDDKDVVVEIRAGTGGDEAALFAADLYRMYTRYAETQGWKVETLSSSPTGVGG